MKPRYRDLPEEVRARKREQDRARHIAQVRAWQRAHPNQPREAAVRHRAYMEAWLARHPEYREFYERRRARRLSK